MNIDRLDKTSENYEQTAASIADRIRYLVSVSRLTQGKFSQRIGMDPANFSKVLSGSLKMSDSFLNRMVVELGISKKWLLTGEGVPFDKNADKDIENVISQTFIEPVTKKSGVPVYDIDVAAGVTELSRMFTNENIIGYIDIPRLNPSSVMVKVSGDSMKPVINDGAYIAIHKVSDPSIICWGQIYVVILEDYRLVKYVRKNADPTKITLHSANPDYDDMDIRRDKILGLYLVDVVMNYQVL